MFEAQNPVVPLTPIGDGTVLSVADLPVPAFLADEQHRMVEVNEAYLRATGYTADELLGRDPLAITVHPDDRASLMRQRVEMARGQTDLRAERRGLRRDGSILLGRIRMTTLRSRTGARRTLVVIEDITDIADRERHVLRSAEMFQLLFQDSPMPMTVQGPDYRILQANQAMCDVMRRRRDELVGRDPIDFVPEGLRPRIHAMRARWGSDQALASASEPGGRPFIRGDGELAYMRMVFSRAVAPDGMPLVLTTLTDVTEQHRAELDAETRDDRIARALEMAPLGVVVVECDGSIVFANETFEKRLMGMPMRELIGTSLAELGHSAGDWPRLNAGLIASLADGRTWHAELRLPRTDGTIAICEVQGRLLLSDQPERGATFTFHDLTELRSLETQRLEKAIAQRDGLVREVHHRIKNNLQGVAGLLQQNALRRPEMAGALQDIAGQVQAIAETYGLQMRGPGRLTAVDLLRAILRNLSRTGGVAIPMEPGDDGPLPAALRWLLPEHEAVPMALILNELGINAVRHRPMDGALGARVVALDGGVRLTIWNEGRLPEGFALQHLGGAASGLGLARGLLPRRGATLRVDQVHARVVATLELHAPAVEAPTS